ncbi:cytochrome b/b6 domain-containing protein [Sphingobium sp. BYY-5]|uniref:cytochrome b/b6 domain-containing protein n=1 Tax=Sphingobium sp. BYY-5 TaxID=2926400 RepID=UPI001FA7E7F0|nr:cytochrome b/b6 domain-containing protein [Sphingobium sp. BYY-5]MCI4592565.1 cytochrome b/b6 domain-containing protein [Sphingobium sp. BYY-5]
MTVPAAAASLHVRIWDLYIRLFHWLLVGLLAFSWWSGERHEMEWHRLSGYAILFLLAFRLYWGFFGGRTARFAHFVRGPGAAIAYLRTLGQRPYRATPGHNPVGGWSVLLMLAALMGMVTAGLFAVDVDGLESGPLADYVSFDQGRSASDIHGVLFNLLLALTALHVVAILFYLLRLRHDLVGPMIHGHRAASAEDMIDHVEASPWKALVGIVIAAACTYAIATGFRF